jgi:plastocyanin
MRKLIVLFAIANLGQAPAKKGGTVTGSVQAIVKGNAIKLDELYVYLDAGTPTRTSLGDGVVARIEQKDENFSPKITVLPKGGKVFFPNRDKQDHNVFSPPVKMNDYYGFDLGRYGPSKEGRHRKFFETGEFDIYCDIHKDMWAKVKVVPTRYFTRVVDGKFTLSDVPPGMYTVVAWAPDSRETRSAKPIEVKADGSVTAESLNVQYSQKSHVHPRLDGREYGPYPNP